MALILEEKSRYDDEPTSWSIALTMLDIKPVDKLYEKVQDWENLLSSQDDKINEKFEHIIQQVCLLSY